MPQVAPAEKRKQGIFAKLLTLVHHGFDKKIDAVGLDLYRITYHIVLLCEIATIFRMRHLVYDAIPYLYAGDMDMGFVLIAWMVIVVMCILGLFTRTAMIANYAMVLCTVASLHDMEYHMFYVYTGLGLLNIIVPMGRTLSVDNWLRRKFQGGLQKGWQQASVIYYYILLMFGVAFVYADSMFYKFVSINWMTGLGMWLPAAVLPAGIQDWYGILDNKLLMKGLGYVTLVFEGVYLALMFWKPARIPLMVVAMGLHLGITIFFPIPWFGLGVCGLLLLMMPVGIWRKFIPKEPEALQPLAVPTISDTLRDRLMLGFILVCCVLQLNVTYQSFLMRKVRDRLGIDPYTEAAGINSANKHVRDFSTKVLGITNHAVFMDYHFDGYNHIINARALNGPHAGEWVPIMTPQGTPGPYLVGFTWVNFTFRVNSGGIIPERVRWGLGRYTAYWMGENGMSPAHDSIRFEVMVKKVDSPKNFVKGHRQAMEARPWQSAGYLEWRRGVLNADIRNIEEM